MLAGELSNQSAPVVGYRYEGVVNVGGKLNRSAKAHIESVFNGRHIQCNVILLTEDNPRKAMAFCVKWNVPYTHVIPIDSVLEIPDIVKEWKMISYYDSDARVVENCNSKLTQPQINAIHWADFRGVLWT